MVVGRVTSTLPRFSNVHVPTSENGAFRLSNQRRAVLTPDRLSIGYDL